MKKIKSQIIGTDGTVIYISPKNGKSFQLKELQEIVDDVIDIQPLPVTGGIMVIADSGKVMGMEKNVKATELWRKNYPISQYPINNDELVVGTVVICASRMVK